MDDQPETYTVESLRTLKKRHEGWLESTLREKKTLPPVRIRRLQENVVTHLVRLSSGQDVLSVVGGAFGYAFEHDDPQSEAEMELLSSFLQSAQDYGELLPDFDAGARVRAGFQISTLLKELEEAGFWVFGAREVHRLEGGSGAPAPWPVAILRVVKRTNPEIIPVGLDNEVGKIRQAIEETMVHLSEAGEGDV